MDEQKYDPVTGEGWDQEQARWLWNESMSRANHKGPEWTVQGMPESSGGQGFYWRYFCFRPWFGKVTIERDGIYWSTHHDYDGAVIHQGVTTSIYAAFQSVTRNERVDPAELGVRS